MNYKNILTFAAVFGIAQSAQSEPGLWELTGIDDSPQAPREVAMDRYDKIQKTQWLKRLDGFNNPQGNIFTKKPSYVDTYWVSRYAAAGYAQREQALKVALSDQQWKTLTDRWRLEALFALRSNAVSAEAPLTIAAAQKKFDELATKFYGKTTVSMCSNRVVALSFTSPEALRKTVLDDREWNSFRCVILSKIWNEAIRTGDSVVKVAAYKKLHESSEAIPEPSVSGLTFGSSINEFIP